MNKKFMIAFIAVALLVISGASIIALNQNGKKPVTMLPRAETNDATLQVKQKTNQKNTTALKEYSDPSGFRFLYPPDLSVVVENNEDDPNVYSSLKLKPSSGIGIIEINVNETNFTKLDDWIKANKISLTSSSIKRTKLADLDAYQVPIQSQLVTGAFDQGALFTIVLTEPSNQSLLSSYVKIINNFSFYQPAKTQTDTAVAAPDYSDIVDTETEEVIE